MPSKRMNTYFKDKLLVFNSVLAIIFALVGLLGDYWWEMNVTSSSTVDLGLWTQVTCGQTLFGAGNFSTYACFKDDNDNNGIVFVYVYRQCLSKTKKIDKLPSLHKQCKEGCCDLMMKSENGFSSYKSPF